MIAKTLSSLFVAALLATGMASSHAEEPDAEALSRFVTELETFSARFEQLQRDPRGVRMQVSSGYLALARPGKFRWVYETPYEQQLISDGDWLWVFDPDLDQATRKALTGSIDTSPIMILMDEKPLEAVFDIAPVDIEDGATWFSLTPLDGESDFSRILLSVDASGLSSMRLIDAFDNVTQVSFHEREVNLELDMTQFDFTPPEGVDVVEGR